MATKEKQWNKEAEARNGVKNKCSVRQASKASTSLLRDYRVCSADVLAGTERTAMGHRANLAAQGAHHCETSPL